MYKLIFLIFIIYINFFEFINTSSIPLKFVTSADRPTTVFESSIDDSHRQPGKFIPSHITVTSKPYHTLPLKTEDSDESESSETKLGSWRRWSTKENNTKSIIANPNEKTFTQQQILDKLFSDYHKHLKEQINSNPSSNDSSADSSESGRYQSPSYRPKPSISSPWPLDIETEDGSPVLHPSTAMSNVKYGFHNQRPTPHKDNGWITLEPIPWSSSKISKWTPNRVTSTTQAPISLAWGQPGGGSSGGYPNKPSYSGNKPSWSNDRPQTAAWADNKPQIATWSDNKPQTPAWASNKPQIWNDNKPQWSVDSPLWSEPPNKPIKPTFSDAPNKPSWSSDSPNLPNNKPSWSEIPSKPQWSSDQTPSKPSWGGDTTVRPLWSDNPNPKPAWTDLSVKPSYSSSNKPSSWTNSRPPSQNTELHNHPLGIITDGKPPEWPSDPPALSHKPSYSGAPSRPTSWHRPQGWGSRPPITEVVYKGDEDEEKNAKPVAAAQTQSSEDESGKWVLLSSTRGYTTAPVVSGRGPNAKRAFKFTPNTVSMSTNRGIRLTVLPPIKDTSTLSHGGMLEVDKTFETVDVAAATAQAATAAAQSAALQQAALSAAAQTTSAPVPVKSQKQKYNNTRRGRPRPAKQQANSTSSNGVRVFTAGQSTPTEVQNRNKALIAAIGAGMLPATMAALVPMFLGKRRRRRRDVSDMLERVQNGLLVWHGVPRSTFNLRRRRAI